MLIDAERKTFPWTVGSSCSKFGQQWKNITFFSCKTSKKSVGFMQLNASVVLRVYCNNQTQFALTTKTLSSLCKNHFQTCNVENASYALHRRCLEVSTIATLHHKKSIALGRHCPGRKILTWLSLLGRLYKVLGARYQRIVWKFHVITVFFEP